MKIAITRDVSPSIAKCELTHLARTPIDYDRAREQHREYRDLLASLGCSVIELPADAAYPDSVFVEDTAIVLDDIAVITRPGAESRRGETQAIEEVLSRYRPVKRIEAPATIDGGDVLVLDEHLYVGITARSNEAALEQLRRLTGREVTGVRVDGCLHLKSGITRVSRDALLVHRQWIDVTPFAGWTLIDAEPFGANALLLDDVVIYPRGFPRTLAKLAGLDVRLVDADELAKAEGGVTCCSIVFGVR